MWPWANHLSVLDLSLPICIMGITATTLHTREIKRDKVCNNTVWYPEGTKCKFPGGPVVKTMEPGSIPDRGTKTLQAMQHCQGKKKVHGVHTKTCSGCYYKEQHCYLGVHCKWNLERQESQVFPPEKWFWDLFRVKVERKVVSNKNTFSYILIYSPFV